ncbi:MAG: sugar transferase [Candidatus Nealsonbacteria bacterium DGGOD1a]|nr:MAG: sugar transferase [Candidatus Nealsonbacteria bacterium DGGOD1a]
MLKRLFDIVVSAVCLAIFAPIMIVVALAIELNSPGPVFYRGLRTGKGGKQFKILKFRTMVVDAEKLGGPSTADNDPRNIKIGRTLRKYKLDEMPQLFNVLKGEMSIVGPRPQVKKYTDLYEGEERLILSVKPGMTDYASIAFINLDQILGSEDVDKIYMEKIEPEKNKLRIRYAKESSFFTDVKIIWLTFWEIVKVIFLKKRSLGEKKNGIR